MITMGATGSPRRARRQLPAECRHTQPRVPRDTGGATAIALAATTTTQERGSFSSGQKVPFLLAIPRLWIRGACGKRLLRRRGERPERPNAHLYATGPLRRVHLRGYANILKRVLLQACGLNRGLLMRQLMGVGTPRCLQGRPCALFDALLFALHRFWNHVSRPAAFMPENWADPIVASLHDTASFRHAARAARRQFCHSQPASADTR